MSSIAIGRLLKANTSGCVIGCQVSPLEAPIFGNMVRIPLEDGSQIYGLVHEIHIDDDGLVRQLVSATNLSDEVVEDNRKNRNMPVEMSVVFIGWQQGISISQTRPPRPPLSLDKIFPCELDEVATFCASGRFGYFRALLRNIELPAADLLTAHLRQVMQSGAAGQIEGALREVIALLKDDYPQLMDVLSAVTEVMA